MAESKNIEKLSAADENVQSEGEKIFFYFLYEYS